MCPIQFARQMHRMGWQYSRRKRGEAAFGTRFNGRGVTLVMPLLALRDLSMSPYELALYHTRSAALSLGVDLRTALVA